MNRLNVKLFAVTVTVPLLYAAACLICTLASIRGTGTFDFCLFDPSALAMPWSPEAGVSLSTLLPERVWELLILLPAGMAEHLGAYVGEHIGPADLLSVLTLAGFAAMLAGMLSGTARDCTAEGDPREFMFTARPRSVLKAAAMPWDAFPAAFRRKYVPVLIPVLLLPFMYLFAAVTTVLVLIVFLIVKGIVGAAVRSASRKDREEYGRLTGHAVCTVCKRSFPRPDVRCRCKEVFSYPVPGVYGLREHTCVNGHTVPCTNANGARSKLDTVCPCCGASIRTQESWPIVISMIGATGAGKTALMRSAADTIIGAARRQGMYSEASEGLTAPAEAAVPTPPGETDSEQLFLRSRNVHGRVLIVNDISGQEFLPAEDRVLFQEYYRYNDGLVFAIDPLEVMAYHRSGSAFKSDKVTVAGTFETFHQIYATINGYGPSVRSQVPLAVVLTRMDIAHVRSAVDAAGSPEAFLEEHGQGAFLKLAAAVFAEVRFFKVTSHGPKADAVDPFKWILWKSDPELMKALWP